LIQYTFQIAGDIQYEQDIVLV